MALTAETIQRLKGKGLDKFHDTHKAKFKKMVGSAESFLRPWLPTGTPLQPADLSGLVLMLLKLDQDWVNRTERPSALRGKRWAVEFAEYIVEQVHPANIK